MAAKKKQRRAKQKKGRGAKTRAAAAPPPGRCASIRDLAGRVGRAQPTVSAWLRRADFPVKRSPPWTAAEVDVVDRWKDTLRAPRRPGEAVDPLLDGPSSPALERYRLARAEEAELNLEERRQNLVRVDVIGPALEGAAAVYRRFTEIMRQRHGVGPAELMREAVDEWATAVEKLLVSFGRDPDTDPEEWGRHCAEYFAGYQPPPRAADAPPDHPASPAPDVEQGGQATT